MKKLLKQLIPIAFCLSLVGCNNIGEYRRYEISYADGLKLYLLEDYPTFGVPGEIVEIRTNIIYDADLILYATYSDHFNQTLHYESVDDYWLFSFTMPGNPVTISYDIVGGM